MGYGWEHPNGSGSGLLKHIGLVVDSTEEHSVHIKSFDCCNAQCLEPVDGSRRVHIFKTWTQALATYQMVKASYQASTTKIEMPVRAPRASSSSAAAAFPPAPLQALPPRLPPAPPPPPLAKIGIRPDFEQFELITYKGVPMCSKHGKTWLCSELLG